MFCVKGTFDASTISVLFPMTSALGVTATGALKDAQISAFCPVAVPAPRPPRPPEGMRRISFPTPRRANRRAAALSVLEARVVCIGVVGKAEGGTTTGAWALAGLAAL